MLRRARAQLSVRSSATDAVTLTLLLLGIVRIFATVLHRPIYGYANNFDFYRLAQWYGIGQDGTHPLAPHPSAPIATYVLGGPRLLGNAYVSTEALIVAASVALSRTAARLLGTDPNVFDVRFIGGLRAALLVAAGVGATMAIRRQSRRAAVAVAACFALVLADPVTTLFLNGLYADYSVVLFGFSSIVVLVLLDGATRWRVGSVSFAALALSALGFSKPQYQALPLCLIGIATVYWFVDGRLVGRFGLFVGGLVCASLLTLVIQNRKPSPGLSQAIRMANATDTWLGAVLPAFDNPPVVVRQLGLPQRCATYVGRTWYDPGMQPAPCPEVVDLSRWRALALLVEHPAALRRFWLRGTALLRPTIINGYGQVEGERWGQLAAESSPLSASITVVTDSLSDSMFRALLMIAFIVAPGLLAMHVDASRERVRRPASHASLTASLLSVTAAYGLTSALLGDGFIAMQHHGLLCSLASWPAVAFAVVAIFSRRRGRAVPSPSHYC